MSDTIQVPNNIPVSWLDRLIHLSADTLMLASQPDNRTETEYMSKYFTYFDLSNTLYSNFNIGDIINSICDLYDTKADLTGFLSNWVKCDYDDPYIISALSQDWRGIITVRGYRLTNVFQDLMPEKTESAPYGNYISSVTTEAGNVKSVGYYPLENIINPIIRSETTKTYFKDITSQDYTAGASFSKSDMLDLSVIKLKESQLKQLSSNHQIIPKCIYMTVEDSI